MRLFLFQIFLRYKEWYDTLREKGIIEKDLPEANDYFKFLHCRTILDYIVAYAIDDVLHLADVWLGYVNLLLDKFHLDLGNFVSLPAFAEDALLLFMYPKFIKNVPSLEMYQAIREHLDGGLSQTWNILSRSNDPRMPDYNPEIEISNIYKIDENRLYASIMCMKLPVGDWEEVDVNSKSVTEWYLFFKEIEDKLNKNIIQEENFKIMFENEPAWKQGDGCYIIWASLDCSNPEYIKNWNELFLVSNSTRNHRILRPKSSSSRIVAGFSFETSFFLVSSHRTTSISLSSAQTVHSRRRNNNIHHTNSESKTISIYEGFLYGSSANETECEKRF